MDPIARINYFIRIDSAKVPEFYLEVNLLDGGLFGYGLGTKDEYYAWLQKLNMVRQTKLPKIN